VAAVLGNQAQAFSRTFKYPHNLFSRPIPPQFSARDTAFTASGQYVTLMFTILLILLQLLHYFSRNGDY